MSSDDDDGARILAKGKGRARLEDIDESTPLLGSSSTDHSVEAEVPPRRRRLRSKLLSVFLFSLSFSVVLFVFVLLIAYSYGSRASTLSPEELQHAVRFRGPDKVEVVKFGPGGALWLRVQGRVGVDAGGIIGVNDDEDDNLFKYLWKLFGRWGIRQVDRVSVRLSLVQVHSQHDFLANVTLSPLELSLTTNPPPDDTWLTNITIPLCLSPTTNASALMRFAQESWADGVMRIETEVDHATVWGGRLSEHSWRTKLRTIRKKVHVSMRMRIPPLPGLPPPGHNDPLPSPSRLVSLRSFKIETDPDRDELRILANATAVNPLPESFDSTFGRRLPFEISLPNIHNKSDLIPVASVFTEPFNLVHPNISLSIIGKVLPITPEASSTISTLLANYISLRDSDIAISTPLFPYFTVDAVFPAKRPKPQILRNVTIRDMKIIPTGSSMLASGVIYAKVVLPDGISPELNVTKVLPDVLIFDGEVPNGSGVPAATGNGVNIEVPPPEPLPDPLPERAFAHIRPEDWLLSTSTPIDSEAGDGTSVEVTAKVIDVPLEVLPGRDREFRNFVGKVIFGSNGALAGVRGVAAVRVRINGLPFRQGDSVGEMELDGLPFQGSVRIGKKSSLFDTAYSSADGAS